MGYKSQYARYVCVWSVFGRSADGLPAYTLTLIYNAPCILLPKSFLYMYILFNMSFLYLD